MHLKSSPFCGGWLLPNFLARIGIETGNKLHMHGAKTTGETFLLYPQKVIENRRRLNLATLSAESTFLKRKPERKGFSDITDSP